LPAPTVRERSSVTARSRKAETTHKEKRLAEVASLF